jgi:hypothetical protein
LGLDDETAGNLMLALAASRVAVQELVLSGNNICTADFLSADSSLAFFLRRTPEPRKIDS